MRRYNSEKIQKSDFFFFFFFFFTGFLPCFRIFCFLYLCGSPPVNRLGPRSAVAVVVSVVMFVCSTQVRRETLGLIGVCFSKVWLLFYSCGLPLNGSASHLPRKSGGTYRLHRSPPTMWQSSLVTWLPGLTANSAQPHTRLTTESKGKRKYDKKKIYKVHPSPPGPGHFIN